ncbi:hypothetical protein MF406_03500 [Georgenia sp. TF02-10]|uniref:HEPN domain-containing protein n=1 Tax=Georgenia sp. TF02-10 TaxID=2917725 RepID=UPI001FA74C08|nr:HEPN domain-containing protein [Georgenia sp. TF02-10]UNX55350.1 hypothetical protein MF406_03500 [Georgenia sp. TF02-10]
MERLYVEDRSSQILIGVAGSEPRIPAEITVTGDRYLIRPETFLEPARQAIVRQTAEFSWVIDHGGPPRVVEDFLPRTLWGLNGGEPFTVLDARMKVDWGGWGPTQSYEAHQFLRGVHVTNDRVPVGGLRLAFPVRQPGGWIRQQPVDAPQGILAAWSTGAQLGLQWQTTTPRPLGSMAFHHSESFAALLSLWTGKRVGVSHLEVDVPNEGWHRVELVSTHSHHEESFTELLPLSDLTLEVIARWLEIATGLGPVPYMAIADRQVLQIDALIVAAALEGLHRRLYPGHSRTDEHQTLAGVSRTKLRKASSAAVKAALKALNGLPVNYEQAERVYQGALASIHELSFREKLVELLPQVDEVAPGLLGPDLKEWVGDLVQVRNVQAHLLKDHDDFGEKEMSQCYVLGLSGRWALRILLLLQVASSEQIRKALSESSQFSYALANLDRESVWDNFSAYERFHSSQ